MKDLQENGTASLEQEMADKMKAMVATIRSLGVSIHSKEAVMQGALDKQQARIEALQIQSVQVNSTVLQKFQTMTEDLESLNSQAGDADSIAESRAESIAEQQAASNAAKETTAGYEKEKEAWLVEKENLLKKIANMEEEVEEGSKKSKSKSRNGT